MHPDADGDGPLADLAVVPAGIAIVAALVALMLTLR